MSSAEGLSERDERPEKREERRRTVRATAARPRVVPACQKARDAAQIRASYSQKTSCAKNAK
ncbi:hypothetical protein M404DRAFT_995150 [Pisolithus tinctorius Marx 270]|uniref:Uncharacterized protein n=1 Tax=Pisolithus tinctorius Marx 270 TaxID=870435 RepID=A0A0C3KM30_PISTI|nr:hypothetical protein M404DRAFT_995150 [Pisolithus tinctorius Marx 270]